MTNALMILAIPALPALVGLLMMPLSRKLRNALIYVPVASITISMVLSIIVAAQSFTAGLHGEEKWFEIAWNLGVLNGTPLNLSIGLDSKGIVMLLVVTIVSFCVHVYSLSYMGEDKRRGWYYSVLSLFSAAMLALVMSDNLLLIFAMWEMMGLCSYLLIGFWWEDEAPRKAAQKAFLTTRVGDLGFLVAIFAIYATFGSFDMTTILGATYTPVLATVISVGILIAAMGKSAQIPLHVWLPDAMAGPTPSSALIHAATMVAAGVFVVARFLPVFEQAPGMLTAVCIIGCITAFLAATMAVVQYDIKKVLAYSTISQLGMMFIALGVGSSAAAMFHLFTHAFFKALLFMASGIIIHAVHTQDMREMGGIAKRMPWTTVVYTIGALALAGVVPFAGFFSKDEILTVVFHAGNWWAFAATAATSLFTAFYMVRLWVQVFLGTPETKEAEHAHDGDLKMMLPVSILAALTTVVGFGFIPLAKFWGEHGAWPELLIAGISTAVALAGIALGFVIYGRGKDKRPTERTHKLLGPFYALPAHKYYFDALYDFVFVKGFMKLSDGLAIVDKKGVDGVVNGAAKGYAVASKGAWKFDSKVVDGIVNLFAGIARFAGAVFRSLQTGRLRTYQKYVLVIVVIFMVIIMMKGVLA